MSKDFNNLQLSIDLLPESELSKDSGTTQEKLFRIFEPQFEDIDFAAAQIRFLLDFAKNFGVNLDIVGAIIGIRRQGLSDDDYKILLDIIANDAKPGAINIIKTFKRLIGSSVVTLQELFPAAYLLTADSPSPIIDEIIIKNIIQSITPEGIRVFLVMVPADPFRFDIGSGFGNALDPLVGGKFAELI